MFTTHNELNEFKRSILRVLNDKDGALELNDFCKYFREVTGTRIQKWFKQVKKNESVPSPLRLLQEFCSDVVEVDLTTGNNPIVKVVKDVTSTESSFHDHLKSMSAKQCEEQLKRTVEHVQGSSKDCALSVDDDDVVVVKAASNSTVVEQESEIQDLVEKFGLYRDFQMIHISYIKLRIISMYNNYGDLSMELLHFMHLFKAMYCENFFTRAILKHFVSDQSLKSEEYVANFIRRFCTDFLVLSNVDMTVKVTQSIPSAHVKFLNQLIASLEKLATPGYAVKELDPTPAEMMLLGKSVTEEGAGINTKTLQNRHTFINFPMQSNDGMCGPGVSGADRPTLQELNERVNQIRNRMCREGLCVKLVEVIQDLCSFYKVSCVGELYPLNSRPIRREGDIPALYEIMQANGKVNAFIQAFVEFRNVCTLHELEEEICKMEGKATFADLKLGPLQKQLLVYEFFKFPPEKETIPAITTLEVFRLLWKCQSEMHHNQRRSGGSENKERDRLTLHQFMDYFIKQHDFNDPFESGVRINSIGLAISVVRKAWFGDMYNIRNSVQKFTKQLCDDFDQHLNHARSSITGGKGEQGERDNLIKKISGMNLLDGFSEMYGMLQKMKKDACKTLPGTAHLVNFSDITMNALSVIQKDELMRRIFHILLSVAPMRALKKDDRSILNSLGFKNAIDQMVKDEAANKTNAGTEKKTKKPVASKGLLTKTMKKWFAKNSELNVEVLSKMEYQVTKEMGETYDTFDDFGHGSFLHFINSDPKFRDCVDNSLGLANTTSRRLVTKKETTEFVNQCGEGAKMEDIKKALSHQFHIQSVDGSLVTQIEDALEMKQQNTTSSSTSSSNISYQHAFLSGSDIHDEVSASETQYFAQCAVTRIVSAPYLVDLHSWTNWDVMYRNKLGLLKDFLQNIPQAATMNFFFMQIRGSKFIKVLKDCPYEHLLHGLKEGDAPKTCTCIVSILVSGCHISDAPVALLANHIQKALLEWAGKGGVESGDIINFCLDCFTLLPFEILTCVIRKLFLSPLAEVFGSQNVSELLLNSSAPYTDQRNVLHMLGVHLAIEEWKKDYESELRGLSTQKGPAEPVICIDDEESEKSPVCIDVEKHAEEKPAKKKSVSGKVEPIVVDVTKAATVQVDDEEVIAVSEVKGKPGVELIIDCKTVTPKPTAYGEEDFHVEIMIEDSEAAVVESEEEAVLSVVMDMINSIASEDEDGEEEEEEETDPVEIRAKYCHKYVEDIRRDQFGVGLKFGEEEERLINILRERQGRSLYRLSQELYTKDSHFVLELIQNADDNEYQTSDGKEEEMGGGKKRSLKPTVAFIVEEDKITILNNEKGFQEENIKALCDVGKSTKGIHRKGYIGQKGIGFKSVFRVTDNPQIHSNGFHIKFDAVSGPNGYICPQWIEDWRESSDVSYQPSPEETFEWTTKIVLPLKDEMQHSKLTSRFHDIHPSLLMFLNRLQTIIIDDKVSGSLKVMRKEHKEENMVQLSHNHDTSLWLVVDKDIPIDVREDVKNTGISVAFPVQFGNNEVKTEDLPVQPVFAFLPLRSYGFKFIIQADFEVPSSREDIDKDSSWNQCILSHIPQLVVHAFHSFKGHSHFKDLQGVINYFKFMDVEGHVLGVFKQVGRNIIKCLQRENCLPVDVSNSAVTRRHKQQTWMIPSSVVVSQPHNKLVVHPEMLKEHLGLYYVHKDVQEKIPSYILKILGVSKLTFQQLVDIAKAMVRSFNERQVDDMNKEVKEMHGWLGRWLHMTYKTLQENCDCSQQTLDVLRTLNVYALSDGNLASLDKSVVFFPMDDSKQSKKGKADGKVGKELELIENDLCILSRALISQLNEVQVHEVKRLLKDLGVKMMTPFDLVHNIIIPIFKSGKWKDKSEPLLVAFVSYLHSQLLVDAELFDINDVKEDIALLTNKGFVRPADELIYFTVNSGNPTDLAKKFPACNWTLISDSAYLKHDFSAQRRKQWQDFFARLGLKYFALLREKKETLHKSDLATSAWSACSEKWPKTVDDTYVINDLVCPEFTALLKTTHVAQISAFALELDERWKDTFAAYKLGGEPGNRRVENTKGDVITRTLSSFTLQMRSASWLPSTKSKSKLFAPRDLYLPIPRITDLLCNKANYLSEKIQDKKFISTLSVLAEVSFEKFVESFRQWREEKLFKTTFQHTVNIYNYLKTKVSKHPDEIKELVDGDFVFLLSSHCNQRLTPDSVAEGRFFKIKDLVWEDPSGILVKSEHVNHRRLLKGYYPDEMRDFFVDLGVDRYPTMKEYLNLVFDIASKTTLPDKKACLQICTLFSIIGDNCIQENYRDDISRNWYLPVKLDERKQLYADLDGVMDSMQVQELQNAATPDEKIFPTAANKFASLAEIPYLAFNEDLSPVFKKEENVVILSIDSIISMLKPDKGKSDSRQTFNKRAEENEQMRNVIRCLAFFKACSIRLLSDVYIQPEVITEGFNRGCRKWEQVLHDIAPYMQMFIAAKLGSVYAHLKAANFHEYLKNSQFFVVQKLEVVYRLENRRDVNVKQTKVCHVDDMDGKRAFIQITAADMDEKSQHENILSELMTLFLGKVQDQEAKELLLDFALVPQKQSYLSRKNINPVPRSDPKWSYPEPERLPPPPPKIEVALPTLKPKDGEQKLTFWPPRDPSASSTVSKPASVRVDEEEMLKKWKQPTAPGMEADTTIPATAVTPDSSERSAPPPSAGGGVASSSSSQSNHPTPLKPSAAGSTPHQPSAAGSTPVKPVSSSAVVGGEGASAASSEQPCTPAATVDAGTANKETCGTAQQSESQIDQQSQETSDPTVVGVPSGQAATTESGANESQSPSEGQKRKREPSGMETDEKGTPVKTVNADSTTSTPKPKKACYQPTQHPEVPDYSAPQEKNLTTNIVNLAIEGFASHDLDAEYEDLPYQGNDELEEGEITVPTEPTNQSAIESTARIGEELVYKHLCNVYKDDIISGAVKVDWLNTDSENKLPYDVKVSFAQSDRSLPIYIEVKTTIEDERKQFSISSQQLKFAFKEGACFHLYRVSNLYKESNVRIRRLVNLSSYMDRKAVKLFMLL